MSSAKWSSLATLSSGISSANLDASGGTTPYYVSTTIIDNSAAGGRYRYLAFEATFDADSTVPSANKTIEFYLIKSLDGTSFEDGDEAPPVVTGLAPIAVMALAAQDVNQRAFEGIPMPPCKFKIVAKAGSLDYDGVITVDAYGYNEEAV